MIINKLVRLADTTDDIGGIHEIQIIQAGGAGAGGTRA